MAVTSESTTVWNGDLKSGSGTLTLDSSHAAEFPVNWAARSEGRRQASPTPEELLGAAHSACFSMAFSNILASFGTHPRASRSPPPSPSTPPRASPAATSSSTRRVPGISEEDFQRLAEEAKATCPVSRALVGIPITIDADPGLSARCGCSSPAPPA